MMSGIKAKDTQPEMLVRRYLHGMGFRYQLHNSKLPGRPDIVLPKYKTIIFVHGCFWHRHSGCTLAYNPKSNIEAWQKKFKGNIARDKKNLAELADLGWRVIIIWECNLRKNKSESLTALSNAIL
jgi:DNA mismatch endonuclease (patch repair protein)